MSTRTRNFACIVYPESAPENWLDILDSFHVPAFVSPLHDSDLNPDGELKKAHYHVMLMFEGVKSQSQVSELITAIHGVGDPPINSIRGYARYLCHLDNPEKTQYRPQDVLCFGGADYLDTISLPSDGRAAVHEMLAYVSENRIFDLCDLMDYAISHRPDWDYVLTAGSPVFVLNSYLKSKTNKADRIEALKKVHK